MLYHRFRMSDCETRKKLEAEGLFTFRKNPVKGQCCVVKCRAAADFEKKKVGGFWFCHAHWQTRWRSKSPKMAYFRNVRDHASARRILFSISFDYFCGLMDAAAAWDLEAESRGDILTVDRIDATKGYEVGNLRIVTLSENSIKGNRERFLPEHVQAILQRRREETRTSLEEMEARFNDDPF